MPILTEPMKKYLVNDSKKGYTAEAKSTYNRRIVEYAVRGLKDLTLLAEKLPEDLQAEIFNETNLRLLIRNIFRGHIKKDYEEAELEQRRERILRLSYETLTEIGFRDNAWDLAPDVMKILINAGLHETFDTIVGLKAIYIKGFSMPEKEVKK
ncbi:hypothetical protein KEJ15_02790 [Candidatus Bathyarchaeota archaeon]|nr:hypothetical protein [Candidatus Bathyarchaeota archaeon]